MFKGLFTASTGMEAQQTRIAVIANNIANTNTTGFKTSRAEFQDLVYQTFQAPGAEAAAGQNKTAGIQVGTGVQVVSTQMQFIQGALETTGRQLDVAINGKGFIQVQLPNQELAYTRAGSLAIDNTGALVTQDGYPVQPAVSLTPEATNRTIGTNGTITETIPGSTPNVIGNAIQIFTFPNETGLEQVGKNLYRETVSSGAGTQNVAGENGAGSLQQGFLESSNVNIAEELVRMIMAQRAYELNGKVIQTSDQMLASTTQLR